MKIGEAATGVGEEMADVGLAIQRAEDKTEQMRARAGAVEELEAAGTFEDLTQLGGGQDDIDRELAQLGAGSQVDDELAKMKAELGSGGGDSPAAWRGRAEGGCMIVRVSGEGQFRLPDEDEGRLNELDNRAVSAVEQGDEAGFRELWSQMLEIVANDGNALDGDELVESDVILPPRDITFREAQARVHGRGPDSRLIWREPPRVGSGQGERRVRNSWPARRRRRPG